MAAYRTAIEQRKGRYSRAYNNLGVVLLRAGRWDEAYDAFVSALKLESFRYAEASYNLGRVYAARGQNDLAAREWRRALAVNPEHDAAAQALANVRTEERIVVASRPAKAKAASPSTELKVATKSPGLAASSAAASASKSLELDQESFEFLQRARNASERGKMLEAVDNFRRVLNRQGGYFPPANLELSFALLSLKRNDEALANLIQVSQRDGARYPISYFHLARLYEMKGELKLAEAAFSQAATTYQPANAQFLLDLSRVREKLGDYKGALEAMEKFMTLVQSQNQKPAWADDHLAELRSKAAKN
jgi:tetratricopeptide (TPR) repeat protein